MTDTKKELFCPACGQQMTKIYLSDANINVDICVNGCGGMLFDNRELQKCDDAEENVDDLLASIQGRSFNSVDKNAVRVCPICEVPMVKMGAGKGGVELDNCNVCGAKFLDYGELEQIRNADLEVQNQRIDIVLEALYNKTMAEIVGESNLKVKSSARREFFEKLIYKYF